MQTLALQSASFSKHILLDDISKFFLFFFQFEELKLGYATSNLENVFHGFLSYVSSVELRPGEGARILTLIQEILAYLGQTKIGHHTLESLTFTIFSVLDHICSSPDALIRPKVSTL